MNEIMRHPDNGGTIFALAFALALAVAGLYLAYALYLSVTPIGMIGM